MEKKSVIAIVGPTAVGKTALSLQIAKHFDGEVINGDSMQVYKDFWIGTAKIRQDEQQGVPHHLLDICNLEEEYNVARFQKDVRDKIEEICQRGHLPIIVGGTGLYIQAALYDFKFEEEAPNPARRRELETVAQMNGAKFLHQILQRLSSQAADDIHPNNIKRVIRAIEKLENGESLENQPQTLEPLYNIIWLGLEMNRQVLYSRINHRVDLMMEQGLLEEAKRLFEMKQTLCGLGCAIGYKELFPYFKG